MSTVFCKIANGEAPGHILYRGQRVFTFLSLDGHPLVAPLEPIARLGGIDGATGAEFFEVARKVASALRTVTGCKGVNLILSDGAAAGQDVAHLHMHVKPRWPNDEVHLTWDTRTVPDAVRFERSEKLRSRLQETD